MTKKLSLRARAALHYFANSNMTISAERLSEEVAEGRDAIRAAMKELRDAGFLETRRERVGNGVRTVSYVTNEGFLETESWGLRTRLHTVYTEQNNTIPNILIYSDIDTYKTTIAARLGEETMGYDFFGKTSGPDEDLLREKQKAREQRQQEYAEQKAEKHASAVYDRQSVQVKDWNGNNIANLFAERLNETWGLAPWRLSGSRFLIALNENMKKYAVDGTVAVEMVNIFFTTLKIDKQTESDKLWKLFISRFSELSAQARVRVQTPEKLEKALQSSEDSWKGF